jgi:RNA polymerase sigma-70 factor (ECF subfamily)
MNTSDMHDLAARLARGDEAAFAELYDACAAGLHAYLAARLGSHDAASDVVQAAFLRLVKSRKRLRGIENPIAYLFQIARNEATRLAEQRRKTEQLLEIAERAAAQPIDAQVDDGEVVAKALAKLSDEDREIVELKLHGGLTFREIAEVACVPQGTIATRYRRALESLRPWLEKQLR